MLHQSASSQRGSLRQWRGHKDKGIRFLYPWPRRNLQQFTNLQVEVKPDQVCFGVPSGKLLGFIVSHRGIEANPEKINAIMNMEALTSIKDVQKLTGCMDALNRFLSRLGERGLFLSLSCSRNKTNSNSLKKQPMLSKISSSTSSLLPSSRLHCQERTSSSI